MRKQIPVLSVAPVALIGSPAIADHLSESSRFRNVKSESFEDIAG